LGRGGSTLTLTGKIRSKVKEKEKKDVGIKGGVGSVKRSVRTGNPYNLLGA